MERLPDLVQLLVTPLALPLSLVFELVAEIGRLRRPPRPSLRLTVFGVDFGEVGTHRAERLRLGELLTHPLDDPRAGAARPGRSRTGRGTPWRLPAPPAKPGLPAPPLHGRVELPHESLGRRERVRPLARRDLVEEIELGGRERLRGYRRRQLPAAPDLELEIVVAAGRPRDTPHNPLLRQEPERRASCSFAWEAYGSTFAGRNWQSLA